MNYNSSILVFERKINTLNLIYIQTQPLEKLIHIDKFPDTFNPFQQHCLNKNPKDSK